jgi:uncharacterized protein (DUF305 family)
MNHHPLTFHSCLRLAAGFIAGIASVAFANAPAPTEAQRQFEIRFMTEMIDHHAMAVMTAELCLQRAVHPQLAALCEQMREMQMEEIVTMQTWLSQWYGIEHQPKMTHGMHQQMSKLAASTGAEFEIEFMKSMIRHHWTAIVQSRNCQKLAWHSALIAMCEDIESMQLAEIQLLGSWLSSWYGIHNYHGSGS